MTPQKPGLMANFKHLLSFLLTFFIAQSLSAQDDYKRWALELGGGATVPNVDISPEPQYMGHGGIRFNISKLFGLKADYAMGVLKADGNIGFSENEYFRYGLRGTLNFGEVVKLNSDRFNLMLNAGFGAIHSEIPYTSSEANLDYKGFEDQEDYESQDYYANIGGKVQIKVNSSFAVGIGADYYFTQTDLLDGRAPRRQINKYDDAYLAAHVGFSYYFGSGEEHADWAPVKASPEMEEKLDSNRQAVEKLKGKLKDSDGDGVLDIVDEDNATRDGVRVNAKGEAMDTDYDGIPDYKDDCPVQKGPDSTNGCPQQVSDSLVKELKQKVQRAADRAMAKTDSGRRMKDRAERGEDGQADRGRRRAGEDDSRRDGRDGRDRRDRGDQADARDQQRDDQQRDGRKDRSADKSEVEDYPTVTVTSKTPDQISTYYIIGGSFSQKPNAIDFNEFLKSEDFNSKILYVKDRGLFRVAYGSFDSRKSATDRLGEIRKKFNDEAWILGN